ncbi:MAG: hypothetical protein RBU29_12515, partial [bacterium]|nr:hypothetical protein [bacterium]
MSRHFRHVVLGLAILWVAGCVSSERIAMDPATVMNRDVFTCKGLTEDNRWVGVTDQFMPEEDARVVVVASLDKRDMEKIINYELKNPSRNVVFSENKPYPKKNPLGIYYSMDSLLAQGGEGKWVATVYADGEPIGQQIFYLGEKTEEEDDSDGPAYHIVEGDDIDDATEALEGLSEEERFANYVKEVSPELLIPDVDSATLPSGIR